MMNFLKLFLLKKEARLFDTKEFILKTFIAMLIAYIIGSNSSYLSKDMISLLFGMMLTLEPVNMSGIRSGFRQITASLLGAIVTGLIVGFFGYNLLTVALSVTVTLYISLLINWREVSVVAIFTSIYMTQYVQLDSFGNPSEIRTFALRMSALIIGILIAIAINYIFSIIGYKKMIDKRIYYVMNEIHDKLSKLIKSITASDVIAINQVMGSLPPLFNNIDWIKVTLLDMEKDRQVLKIPNRIKNVDDTLMIINKLRDITHISYDICFQINNNDSMSLYKDNTNELETVIHNVAIIKLKVKGKFNHAPIEDKSFNQIKDKTVNSIIQLNDCIQFINEKL